MNSWSGNLTPIVLGINYFFRDSSACLIGCGRLFRVEDPFMLKVCNVLPDKQQILTTITHVDGTARLNSERGTHPLYHNMISEFGKLSGVPVVLNTSFHITSEPIVDAPINALRCFYPPASIA